MPNQDDTTIQAFRANDHYAMIANEILQDKEISMDAQGVATYLLSLPSDWIIHPRQIWKAKNIGRDRVYKALNELVELGYMKKVEKFTGNLKSETKYYVSSFKKFLRRPEFQDPEFQYPEIQDAYKEHSQQIPISTNKDNVFKTMPSPKKEKKKKDFSQTLTDDQKKAFDKVMKYKPQWGEAVEENTVCAWIKKWGAERVLEVLKVYIQDCDEAIARGDIVKSMGACMRNALNKGRKPQNLDFQRNKEHAERKASQHRFLEITKKYVKVNSSTFNEELMFSMPHVSFVNALESACKTAELYKTA